MSEMNFEDAPLRPPPVERGDMGRFERRGRTSANNSQTTVKQQSLRKRQSRSLGRSRKASQVIQREGPKGIPNKLSMQLKEAIWAACEAAGGKEGSVGYLKRLAIENSSAFASLLGKTLPMALSADDSNGGQVKMTLNGLSSTRTAIATSRA
jgi:hypothetical protein